jgi:hypothetical protein
MTPAAIGSGNPAIMAGSSLRSDRAIGYAKDQGGGLPPEPSLHLHTALDRAPILSDQNWGYLYPG